LPRKNKLATLLLSLWENMLSQLSWTKRAEQHAGWTVGSEEKPQIAMQGYVALIGGREGITSETASGCKRFIVGTGRAKSVGTKKRGRCYMTA